MPVPCEPGEGKDPKFLKLTYDSVQEEITGPPRQTERRAKADLAKLRHAAQGQATVMEGIAAMRRKSRELQQEAEFEANVAMGLAQYGFVRDAHKVVDSLQAPSQLGGVNFF